MPAVFSAVMMPLIKLGGWPTIPPHLLSRWDTRSVADACEAPPGFPAPEAPVPVLAAEEVDTGADIGVEGPGFNIMPAWWLCH